MIVDRFDQEEQRLHEAHERGELTAEELRRELRFLRDDLRGAAEEAAENAYRDVIGH